MGLGFGGRRSLRGHGWSFCAPHVFVFGCFREGGVRSHPLIDTCIHPIVHPFIHPPIHSNTPSNHPTAPKTAPPHLLPPLRRRQRRPCLPPLRLHCLDPRLGARDGLGLGRLGGCWWCGDVRVGDGGVSVGGWVWVAWPWPPGCLFVCMGGEVGAWGVSKSVSKCVWVGGCVCHHTSLPSPPLPSPYSLPTTCLKPPYLPPPLPSPYTLY